MKKFTVIALLMLCLLQTPSQGAFLQDGHSPGRPPSVYLNQQSPFGLPTMKMEKERPLFFFKLPVQQGARQPLSVQFHVRVDKLPYLVEQFTVNPAEGSLNPAVELLSGDPAKLKLLYSMAKGGSRQVDVAVVVDGRTVREFSLDQFADYNRTLRREGFSPLDVAPKVVLLQGSQSGGDASVTTNSTDCQTECDYQYSDCAKMECGEYIDSCEPCLSALNQCRDSCPPPPCSPTTTYRTETYLNHCMQQSGPMCMYSIMHGHYTTHYYVTCYYDRYYISRTQNCDGTVSESVYSEQFSTSGYFDTGEYCFY